jgi:transposase
MSASLLEHSIETAETRVSCENCPALQRLERALERLTAEFHCEVGYWKSRHADAVKRVEMLREELDQSRGETRALQDKLFGRKSEKSARSDRSNDLFDSEEVTATAKIYLLDSSRSHEVPETYFGPQASGVLEVDRYSGYKAMAQVKSGRMVLAFCWAHVRRDFVGVGKRWSELTPWALSWLRRIRHLYTLNRERLCHPLGSVKFQEQDALLRQAVEAMRVAAAEELSAPKLRQPCRKVLESLQEHWTGLIRFVEEPRIPLDNNASERAGRGPAVARKNFYGSGSLWSGQLAAAMFSLFATLAHWKINPRRWLTWYLESCAAAGGRAPEDIQPFLPWNLSDEHRLTLSAPIATPSADNTS